MSATRSKRLRLQQPADASDVSSSSMSIPFEEIAKSRRLLQASYRKFFFFHVLALVPTFAILVATLLGTLRSRELCYLQDPISPPLSSVHATLHSVYSNGQCCSILDAQLLASTLALGLVGWLASYTSRKACLAFADRLIPRLFSSSLSIFSRSPRFQLPSENGAGKDSLIVTLAIAMQALIAETLRVLSFYWACCILVTALYLYPIQERYAHRPHDAQSHKSTPGPDWAWRLSFQDPRFFVAAWSSMAWALAEFGFGAFQILHQVALYKPAEVDDDDLANVDADTHQARLAAGQSGFSLLSGHPGNEQVQTPERSNNKSRRMSASRALEQARQRLIQPLGDSATANYGAIASLEEAIEEREDEDVDVDEDEDEESSHASGSSFSETTISLLDQELEEEVERFLVAKERSEVEAVLGVPLPEIPVALCALWRIDAMLWSVGSSVSQTCHSTPLFPAPTSDTENGLTNRIPIYLHLCGTSPWVFSSVRFPVRQLLLSSSFTHAQGALGRLSHDRFNLSPQFHLLPPFDGFGLTFAVLVVLHTIVSSLWATSLPFLGFATTTYASLLFGLAIMVAALARWGLLI